MKSFLTILALCLAGLPAVAADGVFVRFSLLEPDDQSFYVDLKGYIHKPPWYLKRAIIPAGADKDAGKRTASDAWTPWFDRMSMARTSRTSTTSQAIGACNQFMESDQNGLEMHPLLIASGRTFLSYLELNSTRIQMK